VTWIVLTIASALLLGFYDYFKKRAVRDNAVPVVLLLSVSTAAVIWAPWVGLAHSAAGAWIPDLLRVRPLSALEHVMVLAKAALVGASWTLAFIALKHLPLSVAGPIRSTSPMWTILIAVGLLGERPSPRQWLGLAVILGSFYAFSLAGRREGIHFHRDRWVLSMVAATLLGSLSSIYDKYLLQTVGLDVASLQAWFSIYLVPVMIPLAWHWHHHRRRRTAFQWRWSIPLIAITLLLADFAYFSALTQPEALVSLVSPLRRTSVVIPFLLGIFLFGEQNFAGKAVCVVGLLVGVFLLMR
jgi:drug/metabolite transporter (DMT)-like permease